MSRGRLPGFPPAPEKRTRNRGIYLLEGMQQRVVGRAAAGGMRIVLEIPDLDGYRGDAERRVRVAGTVRFAELSGAHAVEGVLRMFPPRAGYLMRYDLRFADDTGRPWEFVGVKRQTRPGPIARYRAVTTVHVEAHPADDPGRGIRTVFVLRSIDVLRNGTSIRGRGSTFLERRRAFAVFSRMFARDLLG